MAEPDIRRNYIEIGARHPKMGPKMSRPSLSLNLFIRLLYCSAWGSLVNVKDPGHCKYPLVLKKRWVSYVVGNTVVLLYFMCPCQRPLSLDLCFYGCT